MSVLSNCAFIAHNIVFAPQVWVIINVDEES